MTIKLKDGRTAYDPMDDWLVALANEQADTIESLQAQRDALSTQCTDLESDREYNAELVREAREETERIRELQAEEGARWESEIARLRAIVDRRPIQIGDTVFVAGDDGMVRERTVFALTDKSIGVRIGRLAASERWYSRAMVHRTREAAEAARGEA